MLHWTDDYTGKTVDKPVKVRNRITMNKTREK